MKMNSISSLTCYVKNLDETAKFYQNFGFRFGDRDDKQLTIYLNWFAIKFIAQATEDNAEFQKEATAEPKGSGIYINIKVDNIDEFYEGVIAKGSKPASEPRNWPWGNREFVMRDPDGYKLVFFQKA